MALRTARKPGENSPGRLDPLSDGAHLSPSTQQGQQAGTPESGVRGPGTPPRFTVSLDAYIIRQVDLQARAEHTNRAALTRKAIGAYVAAANNEPTDVVVIANPSASREVEAFDPDAPAPRVTIQLSPESAELADAQARREETTRGSLARKALRFYLHLASGAPASDLRVISLVTAGPGGQDEDLPT